MNSHRLRARGSVLLPTVVLVLALTVMGVGFIRFAGREVAGASAGRKQAALVACAEAGRQRLVAGFHAVGVQPTEILPIDTTLGGQTAIRAGHLDGVQVQQVVLGDARESPRVGRLGDITNVLPGGGLSSGPPLRITVTCNDGGRLLEVEFGVRFGL
jgi:hypothetical protein